MKSVSKNNNPTKRATTKRGRAGNNEGSVYWDERKQRWCADAPVQAGVAFDDFC